MGTTCFWCGVDPRKEMPNGISPHSTWCPQYRRPPSVAQVLKQFDDMVRDTDAPAPSAERIAREVGK